MKPDLDLAKAGFVSEAQTQTKTEELLDLRARERAAQRTRTALERDASAVASDGKATQTALATELAQIDRSLSTLGQESTENEARRSTVVAAAQGGTITAISTSPTAAQDLPAGSQQILPALSQSNEPLYRIRVKLNAQEITAYGQRHALKPGAMLEADVMQDNRKIWEFVMEPVLAARENAKARF